MFSDWMKIIIKLSENNYSTEDFLCPECGEKDVEYVYVENTKTNIGYLPIWCNKCKQGIQISRVSVPEKARKIDMYDLDSVEKTVPYFKFIAPEEK